MALQRLLKKLFTHYYRASLLTIWTILIATSGGWNIYQNRNATVAQAEIEARTIYEHNIAYRKWSTMHGGIYTKITQKHKDYPRSTHDFGDTEAGITFALIDPFLMTKQAYEVLHKQSPSLAAISRTVSLEYAQTSDPYDEPDQWETGGLLRFQAGDPSELTSLATINDKPYLRMLKPYVIDPGCLKCHGRDTYQIGAIRGGMSVAVPMTPYFHTSAKTQRIIALSHLLLWTLGSFAIFRFSAAYRRYQNALLESEEKFRIVSEYAYNFEYWIGGDNRLHFISPSCERLTGYSRDEFLHNPRLLLDIIHPDDMEPYRHHVNSIDAPEHEGTDYRIIRKDGEVRWFSHTCSPVFINNQFLGRRGSSMDVTEHKILEEQLLKARQIECLGQFAGGIAHDFNNVLGSINTFTHLLGEELKSGAPPAAMDYISYIKTAAKLGKNLTSNLLSFGKRQLMHLQKIDLNRIISTIADILKALVDENIRYDFQLADTPCPILADQHQLEQVLINLCTNARDAMKKTGGVILIQTRSVVLDTSLSGALESIPAGRYVTLSVTDSGHGISREHLAKICEPFFTTKDASKGTGLGLSITFNIIKQHSSYLDVKSQLNVGTTFTVYLPTAPEEAADQSNPPAAVDEPSRPPEPTPSRLHAPQTASGTRTILLADDDDLVRHSLSIPLQKNGFQVLLAEDGKKAIASYLDHKHAIGLVILDVVLPLKNGREVATIIRRDNPDLPIIFISGYTDDILSTEFLSSGRYTFYSKPVDMDAFLRDVDSRFPLPEPS